MSDYERIAAAIRFLEKPGSAPPTLAAIAKESGLSKPAFQRLFAKWVGAEPQDIMQCLTLADAKELLNQTSLAPPALNVILEAATPAEVKARGSGLAICAGVTDTPFGRCLIGDSPRGICHLSFFDEGDRDSAIAEMHADWPLAAVIWNDRQAAHLTREIFSLTPDPDSSWKVYVAGTPFQIRVWNALLAIPPGALVSYGRIAAAAGSPNATRAAGTAVACNSVSFLIPCHRVIRETGLAGDYRWGTVRKRAILAWEHARKSSHA